MQLQTIGCAVRLIFDYLLIYFQFTQTFNESISSIQGGCVGNDGYIEVVVCTYTGRIFGLSTQCAKVSISDNAQSRAPFSVDSNNRIAKLK